MRLEDSVEWTSRAGAKQLGNPSEWLVLAPHGEVHTVAGKEFSQRYRALGEGRYEEV